MPKPDKLKETVEEVKQMGFDPLKNYFLYWHCTCAPGTQMLLYGTNAMFDGDGPSKISIYKVFRIHPFCMKLS